MTNEPTAGALASTRIHPMDAAFIERGAWRIVLLLLLAYTLSFADRQILTLMVDPIRRDLGISDTQFSLLHGLAFGVFYTMLGLPLGRLADQFQRTRLIAAGILAWSLMTACCGLTRSYTQLFVTRIGVGVGEAALSPAAYSILSDLFTRERLPRAMSVYTLGMAAGSGLALLVGGHVVTFANFVGEISLAGFAVRPWQLVFILVGLAGTPLALVVARVAEPARRGVTSVRVSVRETVRFVLARKRLFVTSLTGVSLATAMAHGVIGWAPAYLARAHGWTAEEIGLRYGCGVLLGGAAGLLLGSAMTEKLSRRGWVDAPLRTSALGILLSAPLGVAAGLCSNGTLAVILLSLMNVTMYMPWGVFGASLQLIAPNELRGQLSALYLFCINVVGLGLGPTCIAVLNDRVYGSTSVGLSLATAVAVLAPVAGTLLIAALRDYREAIAHAARN